MMDRRSLRITFVLALVAAAAALASAQAATVSFVDGKAEAGAPGSSWRPLAEGDALESSASIRLASGSYLELKAGSATLRLSQSGTYALHDLLSAGRASRTGTAQAALSTYLSALSAKGVSNASAVAGVRGAEQGKDEGADWVTNETDVYLSAAKDYLASGDYAAAEDELTKAEADNSGAKDEIDFYFAEAAALDGDYHTAHQKLAGLSPTGSESWAPDYELLKARLLVEEFAPQAAVDLLSGDQARLSSESSRAPLYYFILALAYRDLGNTDKSKSCIGRLKAIAPEGELAKAAASLETH